MSMNTHLEAIRPPNEKWKKTAVAYEACRAAGTSIPDEVDKFFNGEPPDATGVIVERLTLGFSGFTVPPRVTEVKREMVNGFEVDITKLPNDVTVLRFVNSY